MPNKLLLINNGRQAPSTHAHTEKLIVENYARRKISKARSPNRT